MYRLSPATLQSYGIPTDNASRLRVFYQGKEVPLYATTTGTMAESDYIEFYGNKNDGKFDTQLYASPDQQLHAYHSLFTDTAAYYLTYDLAATGLRYQNIENNIVNPPAKELFFSHEALSVQKNIFTAGKPLSSFGGTHNYFATFDEGEGFVGSQIGEGASAIYGISTPSIYTESSVTNANIRVRLSGLSDAFGIPDHHTTIDFNNTQYINTTFEGYSVLNLDFTVPLLALSANNDIKVSSLADLAVADKVAVSYISVTYPHSYDFENKRAFNFKLANQTAKYLEITNFNGGTSPVLYDFTNNMRIVPQVDNGVYKFLLPAIAGAPTQRELFFTNTSSFNLPYQTVVQVSQMSPVTFIDHRLQQGDFVIITHPRLMQGEINQVERYANYRRSAAGGNHQVVVVNIQELYDQFAVGNITHPLAIKHFIDYILTNWTATPPQHLLLLGKGIEYNRISNNPQYVDCLVPSYGNRASDTQLSAANRNTYTPRLNTGRIPALTPDQVRIYLDKLITYETPPPVCSSEEQLWRKKALHIAGGNNLNESNTFRGYLNGYKTIFEDSLTGGEVVFTYAKATDAIIESPDLDNLINQGMGIIAFSGHSQGESWQVDIKSPTYYQSNEKYPFMVAASCYVGNIHTLPGTVSMSEAWLMAENKGCIAFLAPMSLGFPHYMNLYLKEFYHQFCREQYGQPIGSSLRQAIQTLEQTYTGTVYDLPVRLSSMEYTFAGDPTLRIASFEHPDYDVQPETSVFFTPPLEQLTANLDSFAVNVVVRNYGASPHDSINVQIKRSLPNGTVEWVTKRFLAPLSQDTLVLYLTNENQHTVAGENKIDILVDSDNEISELCETNNTIQNLSLFIFSDLLIPISPCNYTIVPTNNITLQASTGQPILNSLPYKMEIDTTDKFIQPLASKIILSESGILQWTPNITYNPDKVYYWRTSQIPNDNQQYNWKISSFIYQPNSPRGWNQSHVYQFDDDNYFQLDYNNDNNRLFEYEGVNNNLRITNNYSNFTAIEVYHNVSMQLAKQTCLKNECGGGIVFIVFKPSLILDPMTTNQITPDNVLGCNARGTYGNIQCGLGEKRGFEFHTGSIEQLDNIVNFINNVIPNGYYVLSYSVGNHRLGSTNPSDLIYNYQNEIFDFYTNIGAGQFTTQVTPDKPFVLFGRKGQPSYPATVYIHPSNTETFTQEINITGRVDQGSITSPPIGPAKKWHHIAVSHNSLETFTSDTAKLQIIGIDTLGIEQLLLETNVFNPDISGIDATAYPYLRMRFNSQDTLAFTPSQLKYWRVYYDLAGELGINRQAGFSFVGDTLQEGEMLQLQFALSNASSTAMDSVLVQYTIIDKNNQAHIIPYPAYAPIAPGQTNMINFTYNTTGLSGNNTLYVDVNPNNAQPEKFRFNNKLFLPFFVKSDRINPLVDVTFDGRHILEGELVSSKPQIDIRVKDENLYLALNNPNDYQVMLRRPTTAGGEPVEDVPILLTTENFTPANLANGINEARIHLTENLEIDGTYRLTVQAKDRSNNAFAGAALYSIHFKVINQQMISNLLNYPNPFTSQTQFLFTLTGSEIPSSLKIQILTASGKVVREIDKTELGDLHIGQNLTGFAWNGTDQFGNPLANGVYLYRVVAAHQGEALDTYANNNIDKFFKNGIGKMYLMR